LAKSAMYVFESSSPSKMSEKRASRGLYKWVGRFRESGRPALNDHPKRWHSHPHKTAPDVAEFVVGTRKRHPTWGPRKLRAWILGRGYACPSASTVVALGIAIPPTPPLRPIRSNGVRL
jgi:hypothetical protein